MTQRTEIEFELNETIAYSSKNERTVGFCPRCESVVEMAVPHVASILAKVSEREIYRRIVDNEVHVVETDRLLVCLNSLTDFQTPKEI